MIGNSGTDGTFPVILSEEPPTPRLRAGILNFPHISTAVANPSLPVQLQAITKGVLHENAGNRYKSRRTLAFNGLTAKAAK